MVTFMGIRRRFGKEMPEFGVMEGDETGGVILGRLGGLKTAGYKGLLKGPPNN